MPRIIMVIETEDEVDPTLVDPHEVAEEVVEEFNNWAQANGECLISFVSAEWVD